MTEGIAPSPEVDLINVVTWNTLLDITRTKNGLVKSQADRLPSQVETLQTLRRERLGGELGVVAIQEAQKTKLQHNGEQLSRALGYGAGHWVEHNKKPFPTSKTGRKGEHVGLFGARVDHAEPIELGDNRRAVLSHIGQVAIVNIHTRAQRAGELQEQQVKVVLEHLAEHPLAVFVGDFNTRPGGNAREAIEDEEFKSVFTLADKPHPKTWPTADYRRAMLGSAGRYLVPSVLLDDIYVRGLNVHDAGTFVGDSDHAGLWAKIELPRAA
jgi:endonuclease/exonuclease/phosphatase family metal-dependent hydrolase